MQKLLSLLIIIKITTLTLLAQEPVGTSAKPKPCGCGFQSLLQGGLLEGADGPSWNIQTVNGFYLKSWFAGIGVGLDYYNMRTIPLFFDFRKEIFKKNRTPFLYADAGIHFDWLKKKEKPGWGTSDYTRGFYYDFGAGYKLGFGKRDAVLVSAGYTLKRLWEERIYPIQCVTAPCNPNQEYYDFSFKRLTFKVGWQFR